MIIFIYFFIALLVSNFLDMIEKIGYYTSIPNKVVEIF